MTNIDEQIEVRVEEGRPVAFTWRDRVYEVFDVLYAWTSEESSWWRLSRGESRQHFRVQAGWERHRVTAELYTCIRGKGERWMLSAIYE